MKQKTNSLRLGILSSLGLSLLSVAMLPAGAQTTVTGDITGRVTDPSGATVAGATVTLVSVEQGTTRTVTTDKNGDYRFSLLRPGTYTVDESGMGMTASAKVAVNVGQATTLNLTASPNKSEVVVEVGISQPLLQVEDANISTTFGVLQMQELPLAGGDLTSTVLTAPGVVMATGGGLSSNFFAFGLPGTGNLFTLNGADLMDPYYNINNSGASNNSLGANEVQETAIVANGYTGQYGRLPGVNVNYNTKSGANSFHGTALYAYNGSFLNARDHFNNSLKPKTIANQWGGDIGGFLWKDKIFGYFDDEGLRYVSAAAAQPIYIPSPAFQTAVLANIAANQPAESAYYKQIFALYNGANGASRAVATTDSAGGCGDFASTIGGVKFGAGATPCSNFFYSTNNNLNTEQLFAARVDVNLGAKDKAFFRYHHDWGVQATGTDPINTAFSANSVQPEWDGQFNETHVFNQKIVNNFTAAGSYYKAIFGPPNYTAAIATFPTTISFTNGQMQQLGGSDNSYPSGRNVAQYQFVDDLSITQGKNSIKVGANFRRNNFALFSNQAGVNGLTTINSLTDFVNGTASLAGGSTVAYNFPVGSAAEIRFYSLGIYAQDQYSLSEKLKVTLSFRGDRNSDPTCKRNCFARLASPFYALAHTATIPYNQAILTGQANPYPSVTAVSLQPRIGFAYTPGGSNGRTVIRGGVGQFMDSPLLAAVSRFFTAAPNDPAFTITPSATLPGSLPLYAPAAGSAYQQALASNKAFQAGFSSGQTLAQIQTAVAAAGSSFATPSYTASVENKLKNPQYLEWNLEVQRAVGKADAIDIDYVGNYGHDILFQDGTANAASTTGFAGLPTTRPDTRFTYVTTLTNRAHSNYNGITTSYKHQAAYGLTATVNYTYSKAMGTISNGGLYGPNTGIQTDGVLQIAPDSPSRLNYSPLDYDVRHLVSLNYVWQIPFKGHNLIARETLGGWTISGVFEAKTGTPFSVYNTTAKTTYLSTSITGYVLAAQLPGQTIAKCSNPYTACLTTSQFATTAGQAAYGFGNRAQNSYRGPGFYNTDIRVSKKFTVREKYSLKVGATGSNFLNHQNFATPVNSLTGGNFGKITQTVVSSPSSLYGNGQGSSPAGRVLALNAGFTF